MVSRDWSLSASDAESEADTAAIALVGIGTAELPSDADLAAILDGALAQCYVA
jgi:hypothetical protein